MNTQAPAGWYPQPDGKQRYWDGSQWTEHFAPGAADSVSAAPTAEVVADAPAAVPATAQAIAVPAMPETAAIAAAGESASRPWWKKKRLIIPAAAVVAVFGISAIASGGPGDPAAAKPTSAPSETSVAQESPSAAALETFTMPDLVGQNLQDAQDSLQSLGSYLLDQTDASGQDRMQVDDDNWQVCTQEPAAGAEVKADATVKLGSVKNDESCTGEVAAADEVDDSNLTAEQLQALGSAESYLAVSGFSKKGLIDQLEYSGFSKKDAAAAIAVMNINWNDQAAKKAESYLDLTGFSKEGLVDQLKFEGFTTKQAIAGIKAIDVDWNEQAAKKAESYLDVSNFSRSGLIAQLKFEGFTTKQAQYGAKAAGL